MACAFRVTVAFQNARLFIELCDFPFENPDVVAHFDEATFDSVRCVGRFREHTHESASAGAGQFRPGFGAR